MTVDDDLETQRTYRDVVDHRGELGLIELQRALDEVVFRPGWTMALYPTAYQDVWLRVEAHVEDAYHPGQWVDIAIESEVPCIARRSREAFFDWLHWRLQICGRHETSEWFRWKATGKAIFDPHDRRATSPAIHAG